MASDILLGVVTGAQGLRGEVKVKAFTETPERLAAYGPLHSPEGRTLCVKTSRAVRPGSVIVRFEGVDDRSTAEALIGTKLLVARAALPAAALDEFYHADLVGLRAQDADGRIIGEIRAIHNFGAGDVIELERAGGGTLLLPFTQETVPKVDLAGGSVTLAEPQDDEAVEQRGVE